MSVETKEQKKEKKIVFSEEIDSLIEGLTLGVSFIAIGLFLIFVPDYFGNELVGEVVQWIFIIVGILGLIVEFGKLKPVSSIKGFDDLWLGALLLGAWAALVFATKHLIWHIVSFFGMVLGIYASVRGLFRIIYSIYLNRTNKVQSKGTIVSDVLIFMTKLFSLALVIVQLIKAIKE